MKQITKIQKAKFKVATPGITGSELDLYFQPVIDQFELEGSFTTWQFLSLNNEKWSF